VVSEFAAALAKLRADLPPIRKRTRGQHGKYANYHDIKKLVDPVLAAHGFLWTSRPTLMTYSDGLRFVLAYQLTHIESGKTVALGDYPLQEMDPQRQGSQISYARRYALCAVLDIAPEGEDDDGMAASRNPVRASPDHERLIHMDPPSEGREYATVERGPVQDDPWQDQPPGKLPATGDKASRGQHATIANLFRNLEIADDDVRHGMLSQILGRPIASQGELSKRDANRVIKALRDQDVHSDG
jgi:hypothetical protein